MSTEIDEATSIKKQITLKRRRLNLLREHQALKGISAGPEIIIEIEDTEKEIKKLRRQLAQLGELKGFLEITLDEQYSPEKIEDTRRVVAAMLNISINKVKIAFVREGSMVLLVELPQEAVDRLVALYESDDPA